MERLPHRSLGQIRLILVAIAIFYTLVATAQSFGAARESQWQRGMALAAILLLNAVWIRAYRQGGYTLPGDLLATLAIAVMAYALGPTAAPIAVVYMCVVLRPLYPGGWGRLVAATVAVALAYVVATVPATHVLIWTASLADFISMALLTTMMRLMYRSLTASEDSIDRQQLLARTGTAMLRATEMEDVFRLLRLAVVDGCSTLPGPWVALTADTASAAPLRIPSAGRADLSVPFAVGARTGRVTVYSVGRTIPEVIEQMVTTLAAQASLALDRILTSDRWSSLVQNSSDLIIVVSDEGVMQYVSPAADSVLGRDPSELVDLPLASILEPSEDSSLTRAVAGHAGQDRGRVQHRLLHRDGSWVQVETTHADLSASPSVNGIVLNCRDITETKVLEEQLRHRAFHDPLTTLPNRALFQDRVDHAMRRRDQGAGSCAVMFLDLDDFKTINDSLGHAAGDELLRVAGERIRACLRDGDSAARLGGDEFAVLLDSCSGPEGALAVAVRIAQAMDAPILLEGRPVFARASIGIAVASAASASADDILRNADVAMYSAKAEGKGRIQLFESGMRAATEAKFEMEADIRRALELGEFELYYQPVSSAASRRVVGMEALIRWNHPTRGLLAPGAFLSQAERSGQIIPISKWVVRAAVAQAAAWQVGGAESPWVSINISGRHLLDGDLVGDVRQALSDEQFDPGQLVLEILESTADQGPETAARLAELVEIGVRLALDDFGTGYSSLGYLADLAVDIIKIDRSFLKAGASRNGLTLLDGLIAMCGRLEKTIVVEGVEAPFQLALLRAKDTPVLAQGYFLGRPAPAAVAATMLGIGVPAAAAG